MSANGIARELSELASAWCENRLTPAEHVRLERLLSNDRAARRTFILYLDLNADMHLRRGDLKILEQIARDGRTEALHSTEALLVAAASPQYGKAIARGTQMRHLLRRSNSAAMIGVLAMLLLLAAWLLPAWKSADHGVVVVATSKLRWQATAVPLAIGADATGARLQLKAGTLTLRLPQGSTLDLIGPCEAMLVAKDKLQVVSGELEASITPPEVGFVVQTPQGTITDLGTAFRVRVHSTGEAQVTVRSGKVALDSTTAATEKQQQLVLQAGQSRWLTLAGISDQPGSATAQLLAQAARPLNDPVDRQVALELSATPLPQPKHRPKVTDRQKVGTWEGHEFQWQQPEAERLRPVDFEITVPAGHRYVTVAIDDARGVRVRNLLDVVPVKQLGGNPDAGVPQKLAINWNGLDDRGRDLPDGTYYVRGLSHPGFKLTYEYSFCNPGTPPWEHYKNSGWGGDHGFPNSLVCVRNLPDCKWRVVLGGGVAEGGSPGFALDNNDLKIWSFGRGWSGPLALAAADGMLWICLWEQKNLQRVELGTGRPLPFAASTGPKDLLPLPEDGRALAVSSKQVAVLLPNAGQVQYFNKHSGELERTLVVPAKVAFNGLAFDGQDRLYLATESGMYRVADGGEPEKLAWSGLSACGPVSLDQHGNLAVFDLGADQQVKLFSLEGQLIRTIGKQGGQQGLEYDKLALRDVAAFSFSDTGELWVAEGGGGETGKRVGYVRRIAVFQPDGSFSRHFVGTTQYGANHTALHQQDPTLAYAYGVIYRVNPRKPKDYEPLRYVAGAPDAANPLSGFPWQNHALFAGARLFRSDVSGTMREYLLFTANFPILYVEQNGAYRPAMAFGSHAMHALFPKLGDDDKALFLWCDANDNGRSEADEFQHVPTTVNSHHFFAGWGYPPPRDLVWYFEGRELKPQTFTASGVPLYNVTTAPALASPGHYFRVGSHLVTMQPGGFGTPEGGFYFAGNYVFADLQGHRQATYRYNWPAVHGSAKSVLPMLGQSGITVGELFIAGVAPGNDQVGSVFAVQGNMGQSYVFSEDGLLVTSLFRDTRNNPQGYGASEEPGKDWTRVTLHAEPFGGWFGKQADGVYRYMFGRNACHVVQVHGFDNVTRLPSGTVQLAIAGTEPDLVEQSTAVLPAPLYVPRIDQRPHGIVVDGKLDDWHNVPWRGIVAGDIEVAQVALAHDQKHLCVAWQVVDASPLSNGGNDPPFLFKSGDAVDVMLGPLRSAPTTAAAGDVRLLLAPTAEKPTAVLYRPVAADAAASQRIEFASPVSRTTFDAVGVLPEAELAFAAAPQGYVCEARVPFDKLGVRYASGMHCLGDVGVLSSNEGGLVTERRRYLFNPDTNVVSDVPSEAALTPARWGIVIFE